MTSEPIASKAGRYRWIVDKACSTLAPVKVEMSVSARSLCPPAKTKFSASFESSDWVLHLPDQPDIALHDVQFESAADKKHLERGLERACTFKILRFTPPNPRSVPLLRPGVEVAQPRLTRDN